jgi:hypothetical protein
VLALEAVFSGPEPGAPVGGTSCPPQERSDGCHREEHGQSPGEPGEGGERSLHALGVRVGHATTLRPVVSGGRTLYRLDMLEVSDATRTALLSGGFALGGVLLAGLVALMSATFQHRWAVRDKRLEQQRADARQLREDRMRSYPDLLEAFHRWDTSIARLAEGPVREMTSPEVRDAFHQHYLDYVSGSEVLKRRVLLLADAEVRERLEAFDSATNNASAHAFVRGAQAVIDWPALRALRSDLEDAMRREVRVDGDYQPASANLDSGNPVVNSSN